MATTVTNIQWDTEGEDPTTLGLPSEATVDAGSDIDLIAERLSEAHGWCVSGFSIGRDEVIAR